MLNLTPVKKIMGKNLIGPDELQQISTRFNIADPLRLKQTIPPIPFSLKRLNKIHQDYLLILGIPTTKNGQKLTISKMRLIFGWNPQKSEPCFYNQDWYLKERFANNIALSYKWYLLKKSINPASRGQNPQNITKFFKKQEGLPSAVLVTFAFFTYYLLNKEQILWPHDFIWCSDQDYNGDQIYVGRYLDPQKINKNGFNIHRHLSIRSCHGALTQLYNTIL